MRQDVGFVSQGLQCRGWLYLPDGRAAGEQLPAIVMAHGFSAVKEQVLPAYAERFAAAGYAVLVFDYRYFGASQGEPRCHLFPLDMVEDYRNAITWLGEQPSIDAARIGVWGTSYSGGLAVYAATYDRRVRAVVAQVPALINPDSRRAMDPERWEHAGALLLQDRIARYRSGAVNYLPVVAPEGQPCALPGQETYDAFMQLAALAPSWRNQITLESLERIREFDPVSLVHLLAPTPLLVIAAEGDGLIPVDAVRAAYDKAGDPKKMIAYPILHFDIYQEPWLSRAADQAVAWYRRYLV